MLPTILWVPNLDVEQYMGGDKQSSSFFLTQKAHCALIVNEAAVHRHAFMGVAIYAYYTY